MLTPRHSLNVLSEPRPSRTLELLEASKSKLDEAKVYIYIYDVVVFSEFTENG